VRNRREKVTSLTEGNLGNFKFIGYRRRHLRCREKPVYRTSHLSGWASRSAFQKHRRGVIYFALLQIIFLEFKKYFEGPKIILVVQEEISQRLSRLLFELIRK